jgi:hypothetical protein
MSTLPFTKYKNNERTVSGAVDVENSDVVLNVDTTLVAATIYLKSIPADYWSTLYKLYVKDINGNAAVNNITIIAPTGFQINGTSSVLINANNGYYLIRIANNTDYIGQYSLAGTGITTFTVTDTATIDLTLTPISGGYNLQANSVLSDYLIAVKNLQTTNTLYCRTTESIAPQFKKYENPFQSITDNSIFANYDTKTENGGLVGSFNLVTGTFTAPSDGWYNIQSSIGWALNSNPYSNLSDNANTSGQYWMLNYVELYRVIDFLRDPSTLPSPPSVGDRYIVGIPSGGAFAGQDNNIAEWNGLSWVFTTPIASSITQNFIFVITGSLSLIWDGASWVTFIQNLLATGSFSIANYLVFSGLLSVGLKTITMGSSQLYITTVAIFRLTASQQIQVVYTNNTDLPMYGQAFSAVALRITKLSN